MLLNTDMTVYHRERGPETDRWIRTYISGAWWFRNTKSSITTDGLKPADIVTIRIPDLTVAICKDDYIVKGNCGIEMDTVKDLAGQDYIKVIGANYDSFGDNPHIKVTGV